MVGGSLSSGGYVPAAFGNQRLSGRPKTFVAFGETERVENSVPDIVFATREVAAGDRSS